MTLQHGLDLTGLDPVAVDLHLVVRASVELDHAVSAVAADVSGVIDADAGPVGDVELGSGGLRVVEVPGGEAVAGDVDAARDAVGAFAAELVEDPHALVRQGRAVGDGRIGGVIGHRVEDRPDARLRGAAQADEFGVRELRCGSGRQGARDEIPGQHDQVHAGVGRLPGRLALLQEHLEQRRDGVPGVDAVVRHQGDPAARVPGLRFERQDEGAAAGEGAEDVVDRQVEGQLRQCEHRAGPTAPEALVDVVDGVHGRRMGHDHALGRPGASRGEDDVGGVVHGTGFRHRPAPGSRLQGVHVDNRGLPLGRGVEAVGDDRRGTAQRDHAMLPGRGLIVVDRHVGGARGDHGEGGGDLPHALAQDDGDPIPAADTRQPGLKRLDVGRQPVVAVGGVPPDERRELGGAPRLLPETVLETAGDALLRGVVDARAYLPGPGAQGHHLVLVPDLLVADEPVEQGGERRPHVVEDLRSDDAVAHVPVDVAGVVVLEGLTVDPHLRSSTDAVDQLVRPALIMAQAGSQGTGEHDRDDGRRALGAPQFPQHLDPGEGGVGQLVEQLLLRGADPVEEGARPRAAGVDDHLGEVAHDPLNPLDGLVAAHRGDIHAEVAARGPPADDIGIGGQQHIGRGDAVPAGTAGKGFPGLGSAFPHASGEARRFVVARSRRMLERQRGLVPHRLDRLGPVLLGALVLRGAGGVGRPSGARHDDVAEGRLGQGRRPPPRVEVHQLLGHHLHAHEVRDDHVHGELQNAARIELQQPEFVQRPGAQRVPAILQLAAVPQVVLIGGARIVAPQVDLLQHRPLLEGDDAQGVRRDHHGREHVVTADQLVPGGLQALAVQRRSEQFRIAVAARTAQFVAGVLAGRVGPLDVGHREGLEARLLVVADGVPLAQVGQDLLLARLERGQVLPRQDSLRRAVAEPVAVGPQGDSPGLELLDHLRDIHNRPPANFDRDLGVVQGIQGHRHWCRWAASRVSCARSR